MSAIKNIDKVLFEASSIGIDQGRLDGMPIKHAVYLNLLGIILIIIEIMKVICRQRGG